MTMTRKKCWICGRPVYSKISDICRPCERAWRVLVLKERGEENIDECYGCTWKGAPRDLFPCSECRGSVKEGPDWYSPAGEPLIYRNDDIPAGETEKDCSDLISRQAAITLPVMPKEHREYQTFNLDDAYEQGWDDLQKCIETLPSADRPTGEWICMGDVGVTECNQCGWSIEEYVGDYKFCPNFGAKMRGEEE